MAVKKEECDSSGSTVGVLHLFIRRGSEKECLSEGMLLKPRGHAERLQHFSGKSGGIWLACAEPKLTKSWWSLGDGCVAVDVY